MDAVFLFVILSGAWVLVQFIKHDIRWRHSPEFWFEHGAIVPRPESLQGCEDLIGHYMGLAIYRRVMFQQHVYEFDRVAIPDDEEEGVPGGALLLSARLMYRILPQARLTLA